MNYHLSSFHLAPLITAYQALSNANTEMYPATALLRLSFCWNYGGLQSRNANPPVSCFSTTSQGMKSADCSGKKQTDLFSCLLATFKESKQCVVQEKEHPCESQGERQMGGSSTCSSTWVLSLEAGTAKPPLSFPSWASRARDLTAHLILCKRYTIFFALFGY